VSNAAPYEIPIVDLRAQYKTIQAEVRQAIDEVLQTQQFILGPPVRRFEEQMASYLKCSAAIGVASGSDALLLALMALGIGPGDAVLVPPFTFFSTVSAVTRLGATPFFIDIDPKSYLMTPQAVEAFLENRCRAEEALCIESKTGVKIRALLPVHLFGRCCAMPDLLSVARKYSLHVVEDVAQACGARIAASSYTTQLAGTLGDLGCFSFFPSKTLGGFGDAGLVTTDRREFADKVRMLRVHGGSTKYRHEVVGINSRLDALQAAVLSVKQRYLDHWCDRRIERANIYQRLFTDAGLAGDKVLSLPEAVTDRSHVYNSYVIRAERRDELQRYLAEHGIQTQVYYPSPLHLQRCFAPLGYRSGDFPRAELATAQVLAIPIYPELTLEQQETVVRTIAAFYGR